MAQKKSAPALAEAPFKPEPNDNSVALVAQAAEKAESSSSNLTLAAIEDAVVDRLLDDADFLDDEFNTLADARRRVLDQINARVIDNSLIKAPGPTRCPDNMTPGSAARIAIAMLKVKSVYPPELIDNDDAVGIVAVYANEGPRRGLHRAVGTSDIIAWTHSLALAPSYKWRQEFERWLFDEALSKEHRVALTCDPDLIWMRDCIFRYSTKEHIPFSPDLVSMAKAAANAPTKGIEPPEDVWTLSNGSELRETDFFSQLSDPETVTTIYQVLGAGLRPTVAWDRVPIFYNSSGSNGKSTVANALKALVGPDSWAASDLETLAGCGPHGTYGLEGLEDKSVILCPDSNGSAFIERSIQFKGIVTGDPVAQNRKFKPMRTVIFHALIVALANTLPRMRDKTEAMRSRFLVVPFTAQFKRHTDQEDTGVRDVFVKRQAFIDWLAWKTLIDLPDYDDFTESAAGAKVSAEWHQEDDVVADFFATEIETIPSKAVPDADGLYCDCVNVAKAYPAFKSWLDETHPESRKMSQNDFAKCLISCAESSPNWDTPREPNGRLKRVNAATHCNVVPYLDGHGPTGKKTHSLLLWGHLPPLKSSSVSVWADEQGRAGAIVRAYPEGDPPEPEVKRPANPARPFGL